MDNDQDLLNKFDSLLKLTDQYENNYPGDELILDLIEQYQKAQKTIIKMSIFSPNEEFDEIHTESLKYFLLPYYLGWALTQIQDPTIRKKNIESSNYYIQEFLKLVTHYELITEYQHLLWKKLKENPNIERDDKIRNFKEQKILNAQVQNLQKLDDAKQQREIIKLQLSNKIYSSFDVIVSNSQELEILKFKESMQKDKSLKEQFDDQQSKPIPKMKVWNIPKPSDLPQFYDPVCQQCSTCQTQAGQKQELVAQVWKPDPSRLPNMTLDEFADMEIKFAKDQERIMKKAQEEQQEIDKDKDEDKSRWTDEQTLKDRHWDDWKDDNEKGAGNKMK